MTNMLYRLGRRAARHPWTTIGIWLIVTFAVVGASVGFGREFDDNFDVPGADSQAATDLLQTAGIGEAGITAQVVVTTGAASSFFDDPGAVAGLAEVTASLGDLPNVVAHSDPVGALAAGSAAAIDSGTISPDGRIGLITLQYPVVDDLDPIDLEHLSDTVVDARAESGLGIEMRGDLFDAFDEPETGVGEAAGLVVAMIVLLVAFGSLVAMGLPIAIALFGVALGVTGMSLISYLIAIPSWVPTIASMIGLGVGIDYALFLITRFREHLGEGDTVDEAAGRAVATAGQAVIFAGGTVVVAILGLAAAGVPFITAAGVGISAVVVLMVVASVTLLPALLGLVGFFIDRFGLPGRRSTGTSQSAIWARWGRHVADHAAAYALGTTALLLLVAAPVLALRLGFPDDGVQPESSTRRRAYDLIAEGFGPGANGPLVIAVETAGSDAVLEELSRAVAADPGIVSVDVAVVDPTLTVGVLTAIPSSAPQDEATFATISRLRTDVIPPVVGDGATAHVGGMTATFGDLADRVASRLPVLIGAVVLLSFVLLVAVFRSILVALKAALLNLLSIGAAYGVLVAVFQWGWGASLIGVETTVPIVSFIPMFMFAILFGLSMDYEVFLLTRVRERFLETGDNHESVVHGIASTARVITSAALIMISVFAGFVLGSDPMTKMFGLGLATAIAVDATIVRLVLVPATMELLGSANWWLPGWLDRLLPSIDLDGRPPTGGGATEDRLVVDGADREPVGAGRR